jgi:uncharacterized protein
MFPQRRLIKIAIIVTILAGLLLIIESSDRVIIEILWFQELNYLPQLFTRWQTQIGLWVLTWVVSNLWLLGNLRLASLWSWRWFPKSEWYEPGTPYLKRFSRSSLGKDTAIDKPIWTSGSSIDINYPVRKYTTRFKLPLLISLTVLSAGVIALLFLHYTDLALDAWRSNYRLPDLSVTLPAKATSALTENGGYLGYLRQLVLVLIISLGLILKPRIGLTAIVLLINLDFALILAGNWERILQFFHPTDFNYWDPQFDRDLSFYIFRLPFWELLQSWFVGLSSYSFLTCFLLYILSGNSLSEGKFPGFSSRQLHHLSILGAIVMLALSWYHWLKRFKILYASTGVVYGGGYTDINIGLQVETILSFVALAMTVWLLVRGFTDYRPDRRIKVQKYKLFLFTLPFASYLLVVLIGNIYNQTVQSLVVKPNELEKERPYIERSIALTRQGFGLNDIESEIFNPQGQLTIEDLQNNTSTIDNIRLWDTRPIMKTNSQLQQIRPYYRFPDADIDRYLLQVQNEKKLTTTSKQQVIISARELDYQEVPDRAKTWVNKHLVYTHGYGFTLSPVNRVGEGGLPYYFVKDIGTSNEEPGDLTVSNEIIDRSIPIDKPRIYYGELTNNYVMTSTKVRELDFPSGEENVYNTYDGTGGIQIKNYLIRLLFAEYLKDWQMIFTQNFTPETKLLMRRKIEQRVSSIAPFLRYDRDPYLVVAKTDESNNLFWIIDAYTTSDRYPYSDPGDNNFNYLRNSVKVIVNAYHGTVDFYISDPDDPIIQTWDKIFPDLFKPLAAMPLELREHLRYPEDLFAIQSERLLTYHMQDPQVFYNREDLWQIPDEIYGKNSQEIAPYYLIMRLPTAKKEEFILLHPYTPIGRPNLIGWLAARSDGAEYGKLLLYKFPKQKLIYGPNQIEALIDQDPIISQQISLWTREGSQAIKGNLLIIPIEQSLLYVEPLYLEASRNSLPTLARVIVVYNNQIVMAKTLNEALNAIFQPQNPRSAIIRPLGS